MCFIRRDFQQCFALFSKSVTLQCRHFCTNLCQLALPIAVLLVILLFQFLSDNVLQPVLDMFLPDDYGGTTDAANITVLPLDIYTTQFVIASENISYPHVYLISFEDSVDEGLLGVNSMNMTSVSGLLSHVAMTDPMWFSIPRYDPEDEKIHLEKSRYFTFVDSIDDSDQFIYDELILDQLSSDEDDEENDDAGGGGRYDIPYIGSYHISRLTSDELSYTLQYEKKIHRRQRASSAIEMDAAIMGVELNTTSDTSTFWCKMVGYLTQTFECENVLFTGMLNELNHAYIQEQTGVFVDTKVAQMPFLRESYEIQMRYDEAAGNFFFPMVVCLLLPVFCYALVLEKENQIREMMKLNGMRMRNYVCVHAVVMYGMYLISEFVFFILSRYAFKFRFFTETSFGLLMIMFLLGGVYLVSFSFFLAAIVQNTLLAMVGGYLIVLIAPTIVVMVNGLVSVPLGWKWTWSDVVWKLLLFVFPWPITDLFYYSSLSCNTMNCMSLDALWKNYDMLFAFIFLLVDTILYFLLGLYLDAVVKREWGVARAPCFCITDCWPCYQRWRTNRAMKHARTGASSSKQSSVDQDVIVEKVDATECQSVKDFGIVIQSLTKKYPKATRRAVDDVSLRIEQSELFGLLGPNGAGKTTLIRMLCGLFSPTMGTAYVNGNDIRGEMSQIWENLGLCPQFDVIWPDLTAREHLRFYARMKGVTLCEEHDHVESILRDVGLYEEEESWKCSCLKGLLGFIIPLDKRASALTLGERRRLSIGIALVGNPSLLLLDEPTTGLDVESKRKVWKMIERQKAGKTVVLTTHSMEEADELSDRIGIMSKGQLRCLGTSQHLKALHGSGYQLKIVHTDRELAHDFITSVIPPRHMTLLVDFGNTLTWRIDPGMLVVSDLFEAILESKESVGIRDWALTQPSLEDVFINRIRQAEEEELQDELEKKEKGSGSTRVVEYRTPGSEAGSLQRVVIDDLAGIEEGFEGETPEESEVEKPQIVVDVEDEIDAFVTEIDGELVEVTARPDIEPETEGMMVGEFVNADGDLFRIEFDPLLAAPEEEEGEEEGSSPMEVAFESQDIESSPEDDTDSDSEEVVFQVGSLPGSDSDSDSTSEERFRVEEDEEEIDPDIFFARGGGGEEGGGETEILHEREPRVKNCCQTFHTHLRILLAKNFRLLFRNWGTLVWMSFIPIMVVFFVYLMYLLAGLGAESSYVHPESESMPASVSCKSWNGIDCWTLAYSVSGDYFASEIVDRVVDEFGFSDEEVVSFPTEEEMRDYIIANPNRTQTALSIFSNMSLVPPIVQVILYYNASTLSNPVGDTISQVAPMSLGIDNAILFLSGGGNFSENSIQVNVKGFPKIPVDSGDASWDITRQIGPMFLTLTGLFLLSFSLNAIVAEKQSRKALRIVGMNHSAYWLSYYIVWLLVCAVVSTIQCLAGLAFTLPNFVHANVLIVFLVNFMFNFALVSLTGFVASFISTRKAALLFSFLMIFIAVFMNAMLEGNLMYSLYDPKEITNIIRFMEAVIPWIIPALYPPWSFAKIYADISYKTIPKYDFDRGEYVPNVGFQFKDLFTINEQETLNLEAPPTYVSLLFLLLNIVVSLLLSWYFDWVTSERQKVWFPFCPAFWCGEQTCSKTMGRVVLPTTPHDLTELRDEFRTSRTSAEESRKGEKDLEMREDFGGEIEVERRWEDLEQEFIDARTEDPTKDVKVRVAGLQKRYFNLCRKNDCAVRGMDLTVRGQSCLCMIGPNGAGKTTLIDCINGHHSLTSGDVIVCDNSVRDAVGSVRARIGVVHQFDLLYENLTAFEHVELFAVLAGRSDADEVAPRLLEHVGLSHVLHDRACTFSGGMKRRLSVAIGLAGDPDVLLMDEPTTGVDPHSRREMWSLILELKKEKSILVTTHSMEEAEALSDRIAIIKEGQLLAIGDDLSLKEKYGAGYSLVFESLPGDERRLEEFLRREFVCSPNLSNGIIINVKTAGSIVMEVPAEEEELLMSGLRQIESLEEEFIKDWGVSKKTLEQVYLGLVEGQVPAPQDKDLTP